MDVYLSFSGITMAALFPSLSLVVLIWLLFDSLSMDGISCLSYEFWESRDPVCIIYLAHSHAQLRFVEWLNEWATTLSELRGIFPSREPSPSLPPGIESEKTGFESCPVTCCVTLDKWPDLSELQSTPIKWGQYQCLLQGGFMRIKQDHTGLWEVWKDTSHTVVVLGPVTGRRGVVHIYAEYLCIIWKFHSADDYKEINF